jgi:2-C-methyl-D-erythritol 2,4-cyclodiphosphate synthase
LDALLSACGMPDLGTIFPDDDPELEGIDSLVLLSQTVSSLLRQRLEGVLNLSVQIAAGELELDEDRQRIRGMLAAALQVEPARVTLAIGSHAQWDAVEKGEVLACFANILCNVQTGEAKRPKQRTLESLPTKRTAEPGEEALSGRAREFARAIKSKLPPLPPAPPPTEGASLIVYSDGASRGNPGPAATGWVVLDEQGRLVYEGGTPIGEHTNNEAEYIAVREVAEWIEKNLGREFIIEFRLDSELVVKQLSGAWRIKDPELKQLAMETMNLLMFFMKFEMKHVPRHENQRADALANRALGAPKDR